MSLTRGSGILMPISSLSSPYGIGTLGKAAYDFVDFLKASKQQYWQILPVGPTSYGDSPYQSFSTYAGNPYFVDLDTLKKEGLLTKAEIEDGYWGTHPNYVDYPAIYENRFQVLQKASTRAWKKEAPAIEAFVASQADWLNNYCLFMACKRHFDMRCWLEWDDEKLIQRDPDTLNAYRALLADDIHFFEFIQYEFFKQWNALREYAHSKGIRIIGDLPIYVALDSADVWSEPKYFQLDENLRPTRVAGCPPDYFCEDGQLWGNPLYRYDVMQADGFNWWIRRIGGASRIYDIIRIDHFRGFASYWSIPAGDTTARYGEWVPGPGMNLVGALTGWFRDVDFIAEDLGELTPDVGELLNASGLPGMRVMEFAFDQDPFNTHLPQNYTTNCLCYIATHDNAPIKEWEKTISAKEKKYIHEYFGAPAEEPIASILMRAGRASVAKIFVAQMQDLLGLGSESRMNNPGTTGWWQWRMSEGATTKALAKEIAKQTEVYGRAVKE